MGCYAVPAAAWAVHKILGKKAPACAAARHRQLSLLLLGGALFGVVDHAWNGELLFSEEGLLMDLLLGVTITAVIFLVWGVMGLAERMRAPSQTP